jgi:hypothetical protein
VVGSAQLLRLIAHGGQHMAEQLLEVLVRPNEREVAVAVFGGPVDRWFGHTTDVKGNRAVHRARIAAHIAEIEKLAFVGADLLGPQRPDPFDVFIHPLTSVAEVLPDRVILLSQVSDADTEPQSAP